LPVYLAYFAAGEQNRRRTLINAFGFVIGFSVVFAALGAFAGTLGGLLRDYAMIVNIVTGVIVIALGLHFLGLLKLRFMQKLQTRQVDVKQLRFGSSVLFGLAFSVGWSACAGPMLGLALTQAAQVGGTLTGTVMLLFYAMGIGLPLVACALLMDQLKSAIDFLRRHQKAIHIASGVLLIVLGILMATGVMERIIGRLL